VETEREFLKIIAARFAAAFDRIEHAVNQLSEEHVWHRPSASSNSTGIILQHLWGNLHQWIYAGVGGHAFERNRPEEFRDLNRVPKKELLLQFGILNQKVQEALSQVAPGSLLTQRRIQGFEETVMSALIAALTHLELHAGQISYLAKMMLDQDYNAYWKPSNKEQGSE
jgi:Protein of unknown function (DUF1572)